MVCSSFLFFIGSCLYCFRMCYRKNCRNKSNLDKCNCWLWCWFSFWCEEWTYGIFLVVLIYYLVCLFVLFRFCCFWYCYGYVYVLILLLLFYRINSIIIIVQEDLTLIVLECDLSHLLYIHSHLYH